MALPKNAQMALYLAMMQLSTREGVSTSKSGTTYDNLKEVLETLTLPLTDNVDEAVEKKKAHLGYFNEKNQVVLDHDDQKAISEYLNFLENQERLASSKDPIDHSSEAPAKEAFGEFAMGWPLHEMSLLGGNEAIESFGHDAAAPIEAGLLYLLYMSFVGVYSYACKKSENYHSSDLITEMRVAIEQSTHQQGNENVAQARKAAANDRLNHMMQEEMFKAAQEREHGFWDYNYIVATKATAMVLTGWSIVASPVGLAYCVAADMCLAVMRYHRADKHFFNDYLLEKYGAEVEKFFGEKANEDLTAIGMGIDKENKVEYARYSDSPNNIDEHFSDDDTDNLISADPSRQKGLYGVVEDLFREIKKEYKGRKSELTYSRLKSECVKKLVAAGEYEYLGTTTVGGYTRGGDAWPAFKKELKRQYKLNHPEEFPNYQDRAEVDKMQNHQYYRQKFLFKRISADPAFGGSAPGEGSFVEYLLNTNKDFSKKVHERLRVNFGLDPKDTHVRLIRAMDTSASYFFFRPIAGEKGERFNEFHKKKLFEAAIEELSDMKKLMEDDPILAARYEVHREDNSVKAMATFAIGAVINVCTFSIGSFVPEAVANKFHEALKVMARAGEVALTVGCITGVANYVGEKLGVRKQSEIDAKDAKILEVLKEANSPREQVIGAKYHAINTLSDDVKKLIAPLAKSDINQFRELVSRSKDLRVAYKLAEKYLAEEAATKTREKTSDGCQQSYDNDSITHQNNFGI